ncbi:MAG: hypothetical protein PGN16_04080 [Sphingomonas phyllosphaerae]|uniref:hypothetical protein n=1 Tax=Sphingomonas phyllosphaerae TaxID=257003 RepID=UPI002FFA772D
MSLRKAIAARLDPETAKAARKHWFLRNRLTEAAEWLGYDFPVVDAVIHWAKVSEVVHFASLDDKLPEHVPGKPWVHAIHDFREHLRATYGDTDHDR